MNSPAALALLRVTGLGSLDARRGLAISVDYVRTFFDVTLKGADPAVLNALRARYPEVLGAEL